MVTFICGQRVGTIFVVTYDTLEWTVAATQSVGSVGFISGVHQPGVTGSLSFMVSSHSHYDEFTVMQSTLMVVGGFCPVEWFDDWTCWRWNSTTPAISVTSEYSILYYYRLSTTTSTVSTTHKLSQQQYLRPGNTA